MTEPCGFGSQDADPMAADSRWFVLVGVTGFEPAAFRSQSGCATKLRYTPSFTQRTARIRQVGLEQRSQ